MSVYLLIIYSRLSINVVDTVCTFTHFTHQTFVRLNNNSAIPSGLDKSQTVGIKVT